jgi:hypothetical protein
MIQLVELWIAEQKNSRKKAEYKIINNQYNMVQEMGLIFTLSLENFTPGS